MLHIINIASICEKHINLASYGFIIYDENKRQIHSSTGILDNVSQQVVEYYSIMFGLQMCLDLGIDSILVLLENRHIVCRLSGFGTYQQGLMKLLYHKVMSIVCKFENITFQYVHKLNNKPTRELALSPLLVDSD